MMNAIWILAKKELSLFFADRKAMMISFLVPIGIASFFAMIMGGGGSDEPATKLKVATVDLDQSALSNRILQKLAQGKSVDIVNLSQPEAEKAVLDGKMSVGMIFPKGFGEQATRSTFYGEQPHIQMIYDPSQSMNKQIVIGSLMESAMNEIYKSAFTGASSLSMLDQAMMAEVDPKRKAALGNIQSGMKGLQSGPTGGLETGGMRQPFVIDEKPMQAGAGKDAEREAGRDHIFAGMAVQGVLFFAINAAMSLLQERRTGMWNRLRAAPITQGSLVLGRGLGSFLIGTMIIAGVLLFGIAPMGMRIHGSPVGFALVMLCTAVMTAAFGVFVASLGKTEEQSRGLSIMAVLAMSMLGGAWFPSFLMPGWVQTLSLFIPVRWALDGFDAMSWRGLPFTASLVPCAGLLGFAVVFAGIATVRLRPD